MAGANEVLQVEGLAQAFHCVVLAPEDGKPRNVVVRTVRPCDAAAMMAMVRLAPKEEGWFVGNKKRVKKLVKAASMLSIMEQALLPNLRTDVRRASSLQALSTYAHMLRTHASAIGGAFRSNTTAVSESLLMYVNEATAEPLKTDAELQVSIDELIASVRGLQTTEFTVAY